MESQSLLDSCRTALRHVFLTHCPAGASLPLSELLKFCANVRVFPVSPRQELVSSLVIRQLAVKVTKRPDDARLTYAQFEQFLRLLAAKCYAEGSEQSRLKALLSHMRIGCSDYGMQIFKEQRPEKKDSNSSSASIHDSKPRHSDLPQTRSSLRLKIPHLKKKLSLTTVGFSKVLGLQHIYQPQTQLRRRPSAETLAFRSPRSTTARIPPTPSSRLHTRHESVPEDLLSRVKEAVRRFEGQARKLGCGRGITMRAIAFVRRLHRRRIQAVRHRQRTTLMLGFRTWRLQTLRCR